MSHGGAERHGQVVTSGTRAAPGSPGIVGAMNQTSLAAPVVAQVRGIRKTYGEVTALDGVDLTITRGEIVAILGPNGAGKTTLLEILLGLRESDAGSATLFGARPGAPGGSARIGAMLQDTDVPELLTVREIVDLTARYYPLALPVNEALARADLTAKANERATKLSGGQRQRLSFAMSIVGDPDLLFLDEPTAALDVVARRAFWAQVREFAVLGKTVLFSSHHLDEVSAVADRVVVIQAGRVVADGGPREIAARFGAKEIRMVTDADTASLRTLPGVTEVQVLDTHEDGHADEGHSDEGHAVVLTCTTPEQALAALFAAGRRVEGLTVTDADLEAAFVRLTATDDRSSR